MWEAKEFKRYATKGFTLVEAHSGLPTGEIDATLAELTNYGADQVRKFKRGSNEPSDRFLKAFVSYCVTKGHADRAWARQLLRYTNYADSKVLLRNLFDNQNTLAQKRVFIGYHAGVQPDRRLAVTLAGKLAHHYHVFFEPARGDGWDATMRDQLERADVVILLLSADALHSYPLTHELELADELAQVDTHHYRMLPVWIEPARRFFSQLPPALTQTRWCVWRNNDDTPTIIKQLKAGILGAPLPHSTPPAFNPTPQNGPISESPSDVLPLNSHYYIVRMDDRHAQKAMEHNSVTITIKGSRRMGKSSLLLRLEAVAKQHGKRFIMLDIRTFQAVLHDGTQFFRYFAQTLVDLADITPTSHAVWESVRKTEQDRCTRFVETQLLEQTETVHVLAIDNADLLFDAPFRNEFFAMLRAWHEKRVDGVWRRLSLVVVTSTEPYLLIDDERSPFNVGEVFELRDFTLAEMAELNERHDRVLSAEQLRQLHALVGGHPYLVRRTLYLVANSYFAFHDLLTQADLEDGPFGEHLRAITEPLNRNATLRNAMQEVITTQRCSKPELLFRLRGAGLVRRERRHLFPRCQLYADYFEAYFE